MRDQLSEGAIRSLKRILDRPTLYLAITDIEGRVKIDQTFNSLRENLTQLVICRNRQIIGIIDLIPEALERESGFLLVRRVGTAILFAVHRDRLRGASRLNGEGGCLFLIAAILHDIEIDFACPCVLFRGQRIDAGIGVEQIAIEIGINDFRPVIGLLEGEP